MITPEPEKETSPYLRIGEVAQRTGFTPRTLRYYEEMGLLQPPDRMEGGFRLYGRDDLERLDLIKTLKELLGLSLTDVRVLVEAEEEIGQLRGEYRDAADPEVRRAKLESLQHLLLAQLALIDRRAEQLRQMRHRWEERLEHCRHHLAELGTRPEAARS